MTEEDRREAHQHRRAGALSMGSPRKLEEKAARGELNARQRIDYLLEPGSFHEIGLFAASARPEDRERTPTDGLITGTGYVDGRMVAVAASDFSVVGVSAAPTNSRKFQHLNKLAREQGMALLILGECSGARMPDIMGAEGIGNTGLDYTRIRANPWISAVLGQSYGASSWRAALSDLVIQRKGAIMAVCSVKVTEVAISEEIDPERLGGWDMRSAVAGETDLVADTDEAALDAVRRYASYLPSHAGERAPRLAVPAGSDEGAHSLHDLVPEARSKVYDIRKVIEAVVDLGSFAPVKPRFSRVAVTGFARINGHVVGIIASNPYFKGGALDGDACRKMTSFVVLCDSYNIPLVFLTDTPGFLVGVEGERQGLAGKIMNFIQALEPASVPKFAVILRKSYGQAYLNMGGKHDQLAAWYTADVGFMDPDVDDPERFTALREELARGTSAYDLAAGFYAKEVLDPAETRDYLKRLLDIYQNRPSGGVGEHRLSYWPTHF